MPSTTTTTTTTNASATPVARENGQVRSRTVDGRSRPLRSALADAERSRRGPSVGENHFVIVGGGLAGTLLALALAKAGRGKGVVLVEQDTVLLGNHTWSFHHSDLSDDERQLVAPFVRCTWPRQIVRFPGRERIIETGYASIVSDDFARLALPRLEDAGVKVVLGRAVASISESAVELEDGSSFLGQVVIDARGPNPLHPGAAAFQKFMGLELELHADGPWSAPVVMDATVAQLDGFRFVYVLPFTRRRVLVEDTVYSDNPGLDRAVTERRVLDYVRDHGALVSGVLRREVGVLPLPLRPPAADDAAGTPPTPTAGPLVLGYRGGFFHPVTGYSLPLAVRIALAVARAPSPRDATAAVASIARGLVPQRRFERLLNRMLFRAMPPEVRWTALDRFYRLPAPTIARFYSSGNTRWDRLRVLAGRPPAGISWRRLLGGALAREER